MRALVASPNGPRVIAAKPRPAAHPAWILQNHNFLPLGFDGTEFVIFEVCLCTEEMCATPCSTRTFNLYRQIFSFPESDDRNARCVRRSECRNSDRSCPRRKHHESCGTACPAHCGNLNPRYCTEQCVSGCFCDEGYVLERNDMNARCIRSRECSGGGGGGGCKLIPYRIR